MMEGPINERIVVTGAAGFMGSHLMEYLNGHSYRPIGVDDFSGGFKRNIKPHWKFHRLDLSDRQEVLDFVSNVKPTILMHLAANAREGASQFQPFEVTRRNYYAYMNILEPMIQRGLKKVILFSSMAVYGNQNAPFSEDMERKPEDIYAVNKTAMEQSTEILSDVHGFNYVIVRPHNAWGERQSIRDIYRNVIGIFMNRLMRNEPIYIYGDGKQERAFSYIHDSLPCYERCLYNDIEREVFNIGGKYSITVNFLAETIMKFFPKSKSKIKHIVDRPREVKYAYSTWDKSAKILDYDERYSLQEGLQKMSDWAKKLGPQAWTAEKLDIINDKTPETWTMER